MQQSAFRQLAKHISFGFIYLPLIVLLQKLLNFWKVSNEGISFRWSNTEAIGALAYKLHLHIYSIVYAWVVFCGQYTRELVVHIHGCILDSRYANA